MNELREFFKKLIQKTNISDKQPLIDIERGENSAIEIAIYFPSPTQERQNKESRKLIFRLPKEFLSDHQNNLINNIPEERIISTINNFDFQNTTQSRHDLQPSQIFIIVSSSAIISI